MEKLNSMLDHAGTILKLWNKYFTAYRNLFNSISFGEENKQLVHTEFILLFALAAGIDDAASSSSSSSSSTSSSSISHDSEVPTFKWDFTQIPKGIAFLSEFDMCPTCERLWCFAAGLMHVDKIISPPPLKTPAAKKSSVTLIHGLSARLSSGISSTTTPVTEEESNPRAGLPPHKVLVGGLCVYGPTYGGVTGTSRDPAKIPGGAPGGVLELLF
jgi:hypothetical protein